MHTYIHTYIHTYMYIYICVRVMCSVIIGAHLRSPKAGGVSSSCTMAMKKMDQESENVAWPWQENGPNFVQ